MTVTQESTRHVRCPECGGSGRVWAEFHYGEVEAECPYCGGAGQALRRAVERDGR